jgi:hypothetical protein
VAYSNLDPHEGNTNTKTEVVLTRRSRSLQITNDSTSNDLKFRFKESTPWATLHATETISMYDIWIKTIFLSGANIPFRIWAYG